MKDYLASNKKNFSYGWSIPLISYICNSKFRHHKARMVKLVDTLVSGASAERLAGSSPVPGTYKESVSRQQFRRIFIL